MLMYSKVNGEIVNQGEFATVEQLVESAFVIQEAAADEGHKAQFKVFLGTKTPALFLDSAEQMYSIFTAK